MREGTVKRRCTTCARYAEQVGESTKWVCPADPEHPIKWSALVDIASPGAPRKQVRKTGFDTKGEALAWLAESQVEAVEGDHVEPSKLPLASYVRDRWLPAIEGTGLRLSTLSSYQDVMRLYVLPTLGREPIQSITADQLTRLYGQPRQERRERWTAPQPAHSQVHPRRDPPGVERCGAVATGQAQRGSTGRST